MNRQNRLNEERRMRRPYIDGQVEQAQQGEEDKDTLHRRTGRAGSTWRGG